MVTLRISTVCILLGILLGFGGCAHEASLGARVAARFAADLDARLAQRLPRELRLALEAATTVEALSLYPDAEDLADPDLDDDDEIREYRKLVKQTAIVVDGYPALGSRTLRGERARELTSLFAWAVAAKESRAVADCFSPRHALRFAHAGKRFELVICFECEQAHVAIDGAGLDRSIPIAVEPGAAMTRAFQALGLEVEGAENENSP